MYKLYIVPGTEFDYEDESSVTIEVTALDHSGGALSNILSVNLDIDNVNESPTAITLVTQLSSDGMGNMALDENLSDLNGILIGTLSTTDPDMGDSHTYMVDNPAFIIQNENELWFIGDAYDYEAMAANNIVTLTITSTDDGNPTLSLTRTFDIAVQDVNEDPTAINPDTA